MASPRICSVACCGKPAAKRGWCAMHYRRWHRHGDPLAGGGFRRSKAPVICRIPGCGQPHEAKGWCQSHYDQWRLNGDPLLRKKAEAGEPMAFLLNAVGVSHDECIIWPFARNENGYGIILVDRKTRTAHNVACELASGGPPTQEHEAAHSCGNGHLGCVNPRHIRWATSAENNAEKIIHGTQTRGEAHGTSKLTEDDVRFIRANGSTTSRRKLAERFSVDESTVRAVLANMTWRHVN